MYAVRPNLAPPAPAPKPKPQRRTRRRGVPERHTHHQSQHVAALGWEALTKLTVNLLLLGMLGSALGHLIPYALQQQAKLRDIRQTVAQTEVRVAALRFHFSQTFDPKQAKAVMQEQSYLVDPNQKQVVWQDP